MMLLAAAGGAACTRPNPAFLLDTSLAPDGPVVPDGTVGGDRSDQLLPPGDGGLPRTDSVAGDVTGDRPVVDVPADVSGPLDVPMEQAMDNAPLDAADPRPTTGLVAYWPFDRQPASGITTITDQFGNSAVLRGGIGWTGDVAPIADGGSSLQFNGGDAYVDLNIAPSLRPTSEGPKTLAVWFKNTSSSPAERTMIALYNTAEILDVGVQLGFNVAQLAAWRYGRSPTDLLVATTLNEWHHAAYTYAAGVHRLYLDGLERARLTGRDPVMGTLNGAKLGTYDQTEEQNKYRGLMSDLRIYNRALGASEIRTLAGLPP